MRFNPLNRGNLNQIVSNNTQETLVANLFQSPRSGKFESNLSLIKRCASYKYLPFQSPRSGKFESNHAVKKAEDLREIGTFQSPRSGKFESNSKGGMVQ